MEGRRRQDNRMLLDFDCCPECGHLGREPDARANSASWNCPLVFCPPCGSAAAYVPMQPLPHPVHLREGTLQGMRASGCPRLLSRTAKVPKAGCDRNHASCIRLHANFRQHTVPCSSFLACASASLASTKFYTRAIVRRMKDSFARRTGSPMSPLRWERDFPACTPSGRADM